LKRRLWWERAAFLLIFLSLSVAWGYPLLFPGVWAISVQGRPLVAMRDRRSVQEIVQQVSRTYAGNPSGASFGREVRITRADPERVEITDAQTATEKLDAVWKQHADQAVLYVDGNAVVSLASEETAKRVLERVKGDLSVGLEELSAAPEFKEQVEIRLETTTEDISADEETAVALLEGKEVEGDGSHTVEPGQSAWSIARQHDLSLAALRELNPGISLNRIKIGQRLNVTGSAQPLITVVAEGRKTEEVSVPFETHLRSAPTMYLGKTVQIQGGVPGKARVVARVRCENGKIVDRTELERQQLRAPRTRVVAVGTKPRPRH
jgi:LysM repeat protein